MTDERGGRYFREARFFLAGDKVAAQSHILEARSLMGYMRDMHSLGGPPIQVQYATLQDGTQIKAVMMNGQYQAEIVSPRRTSSARPVKVPTIVGRKYYQPFGTPAHLTRAFKWQAGTGVVDLPLIPGFNSAHATQVSEDGTIVAGVAINFVTVDLITSLSATALVYWDADNVGHVASSVTYPYMLDVQYGDTTPFDSIPAIAPDMGNVISRGVGHRYVPGLAHLFYSATQSDYYHMWACSVEVSPEGVESFGLLEPLDGTPAWVYSMVHDSDDSGNVLAGEYQSATENPGAVNTPVCVWRRPARGEPYVRSLVPGLENAGYASISGDGEAVLGHIGQVRADGGIYDNVPGVYTAQYGTEQLEDFWFSSGSTAPIIQSIHGLSISTAGDIVCGQDVRTPHAMVKAWRRGTGGAWEVIPELDRTFYGNGEHVN